MENTVQSTMKTRVTENPEFVSQGFRKKVMQTLRPISAFCNKLKRGGQTNEKITATGKDGTQKRLEVRALAQVKTLLKEIPNSNIYLEDNNGGDYLNIRIINAENIEIEVGHCCVVAFTAQIPVGMLTAALAEWWDKGLPTTWDKQNYGKILRGRIVCETEIPPLEK